MPGGAEKGGAEKGSAEKGPKCFLICSGCLLRPGSTRSTRNRPSPGVASVDGGLPRPGACVNRVPSVVRATGGGTFPPSDFDIYFGMLGPSCG